MIFQMHGIAMPSVYSAKYQTQDHVHIVGKLPTEHHSSPAFAF